MNKNEHLRKLKKFSVDLDKIEKKTNQMVSELISKKATYSLYAHQAEWHIRCLVYHCKNILKYYDNFAKEVGKRAATSADVLWMYSRDFQCMLFEFYALLNIAKISLDNLRIYISPLFKTPFNQLPKSVTDFLKGNTDCQIYKFLSEQYLIEYLIDLRNCLVHYRSFAVSDNALVFKDGIDDLNFTKLNTEFIKPMARAFFRRVGESGISVNVFLPDVIFEKDEHGNKKLVKFTYNNKWNLLSMASRFTQLVSVVLIKALEILKNYNEGIYTYKRKK